MNTQQEQMIAMAGFSNQQMQGLMQGVDAPPPNDASKELFGDNDIRQRTDLSSEELCAVTLLRQYGKVVKNRHIKAILNDFMHLATSKDRKSRKEFVQAITGQDAYAKQGNMFSRMFNR